MSNHTDRDADRFDGEGITRPSGSNYIKKDESDDGIDRRGFLRCMAWAGTATAWGMAGGIPKSFAVSRLPFLTETERKSIFFVQISDSHIGFNKEANKDVTATLTEAVGKVNALPQNPALVLHTGDITQLAKPEEFDTASEVLKGLRTGRVFYVPGEHDVASDNGASYLGRYGKNTKGGGWYSFDHSGVHFIGLVNVLDLKAGGLGSLGADQIDCLRKDVSGLSSYAARSLCARAALDCLSGVGMGHRRFRTGAWTGQTIRIGDSPERPHPPDHAKSGRQHCVSHRDVDGVSAAGAGYSVCTWTDEGRARETQELARRNRCDVHPRSQRTFRRRCDTVRSTAGVRGGVT